MKNSLFHFARKINAKSYEHFDVNAYCNVSLLGKANSEVKGNFEFSEPTSSYRENFNNKMKSANENKSNNDDTKVGSSNF